MAGYRPYMEYKDSNVSWLRRIPSSWEVERLKFTVNLIGEKLDAETSSLDYMGLEHIESWSGKRNEDVNASSEGIAARFITGDVLFGKLRPYLAKVYLADHEGLVSTEALVLRPSNKVYAGYLRYYMVSRDFIRIVDSSTYGSKMPRASWSFIGNLPMLLPKYEEQKNISRFLDLKTAQIETLIIRKEALLGKLAEKRTAIISHAVTKGLDPKAKLRDSGVEWIGKIPGHWVVKRVKFVAKLESGHTPSKQVAEYWDDCNIPWVSLNDSKQLASSDYISETAVQISAMGLANSSARLLPPGAVVFTRDATIGLAAITARQMAVSQHLIAWLPRAEINSLYLLRVFNAMKPFLDSFTFGSTIKTIGMPDVKKLCTPIPPIEEQMEITAHIDCQLRKLEIFERCVREAVEKLKEYRAALITDAVTGKIDVRDIKIPEVALKGRAA